MAATSFASCGLMSGHIKVSCQRYDAISIHKVSALTKPMANRRYLSSANGESRSNRVFVVYSADQVTDLLPFGIHLPDNWPVWLPGVLMALVVPFFTNKLGPLGKFKEELDKVEEVVDNVADRVEEIAEKVEEFVGDIADDLPEGSELRHTLHKVEMVADTIGKDAKMVSDMVDKMDEMEAKLEAMLDKVDEKKMITPSEVEPEY